MIVHTTTSIAYLLVGLVSVLDGLMAVDVGSCSYFTLDTAAGGCLGKSENSDKLILKACASNDDTLQWRLDDRGRFHTKLDDGKCMQVGRWPEIGNGVDALTPRTTLYAKTCSAPGSLKDNFQVFDMLSFEEQGGLSGPLFLESRPDLCVVHQGARPVLGKSRIMLLECASLGGDRALGWEADNPCTHVPVC